MCEVFSLPPIHRVRPGIGDGGFQVVNRLASNFLSHTFDSGTSFSLEM